RGAIRSPDLRSRLQGEAAGDGPVGHRNVRKRPPADPGLQLQEGRQHRTGHRGAPDWDVGHRIMATDTGATMNTDQILKDCKDRMEKALEVLRNEFKGLRTGRASPALLDALRVEYYGSPTPIKQLASVSAPEPQQLLIKPFDANALKDIEKAIRGS